MSTIGEVKELIEAGSESLKSAARALISAEETVNEASGVFMEAVQGTSQAHAEATLKAFADAIDQLHRAAERMNHARSEASRYAVSLG